MRHALFWSGGKDSLLALDRAQRTGLAVTHLVNLYDAATGRVRFHGVRRALIAAQAQSLGKQLVQMATDPQSFEPAFLSALDELRRSGVGGVLFGNIHLADVRAWYEQRTTAAGFRHVELLWGEPPLDLVRE